MVVFAFAEEPGFVKRDFFGGGVLGFIEAGEEDGILAEFVVDVVHCVTKFGVVLCRLKE